MIRLNYSMPNINKIQVTVEKRLDNFIVNLIEHVKAVMQQEAPFRTGRLRRSIQATITKSKGITEAFIGPTAKYAIFVERGTRPHIIRPVHSRYLRFVVGGRIVFAREVHHPGTKPNPFVRRTAEIIREKIREGVKIEVLT